MSILIAYMLIGMAMSIGLIIDRWDQIGADLWNVKDCVALLVVLVYMVVLWPTLITKQNMRNN
jgi:Ca2+/H+ antiporter